LLQNVALALIMGGNFFKNNYRLLGDDVLVLIVIKKLVGMNHSYKL